MTAAAPTSRMLSELSQCAYRMGLAFGAEAERAEGFERQLPYFQLFDRCFFAVRVATALQLRLRRAEPAVRLGPEREGLSERADPSERDSDRDPVERDRDREVEPASLPIFLRTLEGVAADAAALPGPAPGALPTLRELLTQIKSAPAAVAVPRRPGGDLRARLAASATAPLLTLPTVRPQRPVLGLPLRRATGPPRR